MAASAASDGSDYKGVSMDFVFTAGTTNNTMQCVDVGITNTRTVEENETFTVILTTSSSYVLLGNNVTTVNIMDIDSMTVLIHALLLCFVFTKVHKRMTVLH